MDDTPRPGSDDDLAALDFFAPDVGIDAGNQDLAGPRFAVTNPHGTVSVSAFMDGRVDRVDLAPEVTTMTETHLAEEIVVIARLATEDARAAQYSLMLEGMRRHGHEDVATRDFLTRDLDLPSPDDATATRARIFATRYVSEE